MFFRGGSAIMFAATVFVTVVRVTAEAAESGPLRLVFACRADNDLYRVMTSGGTALTRHGSAGDAVREAPAGSGVLILADEYPDKTTTLAAGIWEEAARKKLRLFVEYPAALPGVEVKPPRRVDLERVVVASDAFGESLPRLRILAVHDCHFVETAAARPDLVVAKVAGLDRAVYGLDDVTAYPILFVHPRGDMLVSTTKLSQFVTARYATKDAMQAVWRYVLGWLQPDAALRTLDWTPTVRPTYRRDAPLPKDAAVRAVVRGIDWHTRAKMLIDASWRDRYDERRKQGNVAPAPDADWPAGDGEFGVLEGVNSRIGHDGRQQVSWWLRSDSNGESALAFALRAKLDGDARSRRIAANLLDWVYFRSGLCRTDPARADYGLVRWAADSGSLYGDNDIRIILGGIGTAALLDTDRWDEVLLRDILANFRTTGSRGFRRASIDDAVLRARGWQFFRDEPTVHLAPHYQAWIWASYLWLYDKTGYKPLLERTRSAIREMMEAYPDRWTWTNGIQQERGRMLLVLAWLVRVEDRPEYRQWLRRIAGDMRRCQAPCGAIREELGELGMGSYRPPPTNAAYGTNEASLIQANGDPIADLLYTCNFTLLGLHEAHAATGEHEYGEMADRLADFLVRIQITSEAHPELDGGWFRAFDYERWDYWGSNADHGWGAWSIEVGWTQAWIPTVLAMRQLKLNLWDLTEHSRIAGHWEKTRREMLP